MQDKFHVRVRLDLAGEARHFLALCRTPEVEMERTDRTKIPGA